MTRSSIPTSEDITATARQRHSCTYDRSHTSPLFSLSFVSSLLRRSYDFVTCNEAAEHFCRPHSEFAQWADGMVRTGGLLAIATRAPPKEVVEAQMKVQMDTHLPTSHGSHSTSPPSPSPFSSWWYARDPTHVSFYSDATFSLIESRWGWTRLAYDEHVWIGRKQ